MKNCGKCGVGKDLSEFPYMSKTNTYHSRCKQCGREAYHESKKTPAYIHRQLLRYGINWGKPKIPSIKKPKLESRKKQKVREKSLYPERTYVRNYDYTKFPLTVAGNHRHHWSYSPEHVTSFFELSPKIHTRIHWHMTYDSLRMKYLTPSGILLDTMEKHKQWIDLICQDNLMHLKRLQGIDLLEIEEAFQSWLLTIN